MADRSRVSGKRMIPLVAVLLFATILFVVPAAAVDFSTSQYSTSIPAGGTVNYVVLASVPWEGEPVDLLVDIDGISQRPDLQFDSVDPLKDTYAYSARKFTTANNYSFHIEKGQKQQIFLTFAMPATIRQGGRYAMVVINTLPGKNVTAVEYHIPVFLTVLGATPNLAGSITSIDVNNGVVGQLVPVNTHYTNNGDIHQSELVDTVTLTRADGTTVYTDTSKPLPIPLLPDKSYVFSMPIDTRNLSAGTYTLVSRIAAANGNTFIDKKATTLTIQPAAATTPAKTVSTSSGTPVPTTATKTPLPPVVAIAAIIGGCAVAAWIQRQHR